MLIEQRLSEIAAMVEQRGSVTVQELMQQFDASESTIRRDLTVLDANGQLLKVHGGAVAVGKIYNTRDDDVLQRKERNKEDKIRIARYAASLVRPNDFIYLDAGTTTELFIDYLTEKNVVFVTNALGHAKKLTQAGYTTYVPGGEFKHSTEAIVGDEAILSLSKYNFTKGFWGTNGVSLEQGFSTPDVKEAMVKRKSMEQCREKYILCDASKFSHISCVSFADFTSAEIITTKVTDETFFHCNNILEVEKS